MLVNELSIAEEVFARFATTSFKKDTDPVEFGQEQISNFKKSFANARESWALAVFSDSGKESIGRYFTYHLKKLVRMADRLTELPEKTVATCSCGFAEPIVGQLEAVLYNQIIHLFNYFGSYVEKDTGSPEMFTRKFLNEMGAKILCLRISMDEAALPEGLKMPVISYLQHMATGPSGLTFSQLFYLQDFINEISRALNQRHLHPLAEVFKRALLQLQFNHLDVFTYFQDTINLEVAEKKAAEKLQALEKKRLLFSFAANQQIKFDDNWPALSSMLANWLAEEINTLKNVAVPQILFNTRSPLKLKLHLSVAHLAYLLKLLYKEGIFGAIALTELFQFISDHFSTKRAETISTGGISKSSYSVSQVVAAEIRDLLAKMISAINRDYFPVVVAAGVLLGIC